MTARSGLWLYHMASVCFCASLRVSGVLECSLTRDSSDIGVLPLSFCPSGADYDMMSGLLRECSKERLDR